MFIRAYVCMPHPSTQHPHPTPTPTPTHTHTHTHTHTPTYTQTNPHPTHTHTHPHPHTQSHLFFRGHRLHSGSFQVDTPIGILMDVQALPSTAACRVKQISDLFVVEFQKLGVYTEHGRDPILRGGLGPSLLNAIEQVGNSTRYDACEVGKKVSKCR